MISENKKIYKKFSEDLLDVTEDGLSNAVHQFFNNEAKINVVAPVNEITGGKELFKKIIDPMLCAFPDLYRRTDLFFAGIFNNQEWVTSSGHFVGTFAKNWMGIPANKKLTYLRYGEFHRMQNGQAVETYLFLDFIDLLRQIGKWPLLTKSLGDEGFVPGPITSDGVILQEQNQEDSESSLVMVEKMLRNLFTKDQSWRKFWHPNMMWYGPSG